MEKSFLLLNGILLNCYTDK